ncbi:hypothetical protein D3C76_1698540 [compost metagenome]
MLFSAKCTRETDPGRICLEEICSDPTTVPVTEPGASLLSVIEPSAIFVFVTLLF